MPSRDAMLAQRPRGDRPLARTLAPDAQSLQRSADDALRSLRVLIGELRTDVDDLISRVETLEAQATDHETRIAALEALHP